MNFSDGGFMGYYIGQNSYEIMSITANRMVVRAVMGNNPALAWYHTFTTIQPVQDPITDYTNLVFSDEFNTDVHQILLNGDMILVQADGAMPKHNIIQIIQVT